jgi:hypothetical protein
MTEQPDRTPQEASEYLLKRWQLSYAPPWAQTKITAPRRRTPRGKATRILAEWAAAIPPNMVAIEVRQISSPSSRHRIEVAMRHWREAARQREAFGAGC